MRIAVAGGTGLVGRHVVAAIGAAGHTPVVLARGAGVDLVDGTGVEEALSGVDAVIDVSNVVTTRRKPAVSFFETATRVLLEAERRVGVRHHVVLSIVGVDRVEFGYYEGKLRQEQLVLDGDVPATVLRATQFHEFAEQMLARVRGPVAVVPRQLIRPVAATEVAAVLLELALGAPVGLAPELAGPAEHQLVDLVRNLARHRGHRRPVVGVQLPGRGGRAMAAGELLPRGAVRYGRLTFEEWLRDSGPQERS